MGDSQASRIWSDLQQNPADLQQRGLLEGKLTERNGFNINRKDVNSETSSTGHQLQRPKVDKSMKMGRNQRKKADISKNQNASSPPKDHSFSEKKMENEFDNLTEAGFR
ncbi:hypothetical protein AAY473_001213, partial [Plecturocebus cupreus]